MGTIPTTHLAHSYKYTIPLPLTAIHENVRIKTTTVPNHFKIHKFPLFRIDYIKHPPEGYTHEFKNKNRRPANERDHIHRNLHRPGHITGDAAFHGLR